MDILGDEYEVVSFQLLLQLAVGFFSSKYVVRWLKIPICDNFDKKSFLKYETLLNMLKEQ